MAMNGVNTVDTSKEPVVQGPSEEHPAAVPFDRAQWVRNKPADAIFVVPVDEGPVCAPSGWAEHAYRCFEWLMTLVGFIVVLPVMLIVGLVIRLESPGPALFVQYRVGQSLPMYGRDIMHRKDLYPSDGPFDPDKLYYVPQSFKFLKFRTMYSDARERFPELYDDRIDYDTFREKQLKAEEDPRVTPIGKWLRISTIDELPNLWCVIAGRMRLVGPRPLHEPALLRHHKPEEMYRFIMEPGITGLAMVRGRALIRHSEMIDYDLEYARTRTISLDLKIIFDTIKGVMLRKGAF